MIETVLPPALILILGAALGSVVRVPALRSAIALLTPVVTLYAIWQIPDGVQLSVPFLQHEMELVEGSKVRRLFATIFTLMAFGGILFAFKQARWWEMAAAMVYAAGAVGVSFSGDMLSLFIFWEIMALFSTLVVWHGGTVNARQAGMRYALMHLLGGVFLMMGIVGMWIETQSLDVQALMLGSPYTWLLLIGVLVNTAAPPFSAWLPDAYPEASPSGSVFLSAFTTKTSVLTLILLFPGQSILIWIGLWMVFYGIIYALLENDMRRILSYSIVNQVGFMVVGIGIGTEMALNGAAAHAFAHIIYKALLFMSAGAVLYQTGKRKCSELGGLYQSMPLTTVCGTIGALAISAFPYTSGFISKSLISSASAYEHLTFVYFMLVAASAGVFLHAGIKFPWFVFFQKDSGMRPPDPPWNMRWAMILYSAACIGLGLFPNLLYGLLPYPVDYEPYTADHVVTQLQLLLFAGLAFFVMLPMMKRTLTISLDLDWFWRVGANKIVLLLEKGLGRVLGGLVEVCRSALQVLLGLLSLYHGQGGILSRTWPTGSMVMWVAILLGSFLVIYYY
ncbi:MAG: Na(+)/H(+) antiporter subunit D [Ketobacteraceae bacterium]|nr:Na(+)/H(+) antiporter subunit D [Ketobacteraceae bacterium]